MEIDIKDSKIENLYIIGLIWGYLKYYHPVVASGKFNWDGELFNIINDISSEDEEIKRDVIIIDWISKLGTFETSKEELDILSIDVIQQPDLEWIENCNFTSELRNILISIKTAVRTGRNHYVRLYKNVGHPKFKNEKKYSFQSIEKRLLSLFRFWNMVQYFFPYKYLIGKDWKLVLKSLIPKFITADTKKKYLQAILELLSNTNDTHAQIGGNEYRLDIVKGCKMAPLNIAYIEEKAVVTAYYHESYGIDSGIKKGDILLEVNNNTIEKIIEDKANIYPASNHVGKIRDIFADILRTDNSTIQIKVKRNDEVFTKKICTYNFDKLDIDIRYRFNNVPFKQITNDITYIDNGTLKCEEVPEIWEKVRNSKGLIIDCRQYPYYFPIYSLCDYLLPNKIVFGKCSEVELSEPGLFLFKDKLNAGKNNKNFYNGKIVILINEYSQSSAEFHAMAYRMHPNATVIGSGTVGTDGNLSLISLPGNITVGITGIGVYYPDGSECQRIGVLPDIEVKPTILGISEGKDELIEKAVKLINGN